LAARQAFFIFNGGLAPMTSGNGTNGGRSGPAIRDSELDRTRLRAIHAAVTAGDIPSAGKLAEDAFADGIDHPMVLSLVAGRREEAGRFADSLALLQRARDAAPEAIGILNAIGLCLVQLGRPEEAVDEYGRAVAVAPDFAPGWSNRGTALLLLGKPQEARADFERALAIDPDNLVALNGLAALALWRGDPAEARALAMAVSARHPGLHGPLLTLAGADIAEGKAGLGEARLRLLLGDDKLPPLDRAAAHGLLGDALDADGRHHEAFLAYEEGNRLRQAHHGGEFGGRRATLDLMRAVTGALEGKRFPTIWGRGESGTARRHVFLIGFPRSGTTLIEQVLAAHDDVVTLAEKECLIGTARAWMMDAESFEQFCRAPDEELDRHRAAYWHNVAEEGAHVSGKVFVDKHPFNTFKLPLIARLFPEARILFARRDPRDIVLSCFRHRFAMTDPAYQMLTLEGAAELYAATMAMTEATEKAFGLFVQPCRHEAIVADFDGEMRQICAFAGVDWTPGLRDFADRLRERGTFMPGAPQLAQGLSARGVGRWRDYAGEMAAVLPILEPWVRRDAYE
jgi:tetratricopeptide (TPR) repeat protein